MRGRKKVSEWLLKVKEVVKNLILISQNGRVKKLKVESVASKKKNCLDLKKALIKKSRLCLKKRLDIEIDILKTHPFAFILKPLLRP